MTIQDVAQKLKRHQILSRVSVSERVWWDKEFPSSNFREGSLDSSFVCEFQEKGYNRRSVTAFTLEELLEIVESRIAGF